MTSPYIKILIVEDSESLQMLYQTYLAKLNAKITIAGTVADGLKQVNEINPDIILLDLQLPDSNGMEILRYVHENNLTSNVIVMTAYGSVENAIEAIRLGADDFLTKPIDGDRLRVTIKNTLKLLQLNQIVDNYQQQFSRQQFEGFIGSSMPMQNVYRIIESAAPSKATIFITGESGTGKELCAQAIHNRSDRPNGAFVALNCAAIPKDLIESEIFGHVKGAFTGAISERKGAAGRANGGTLFLDEICEMDIDLQSKLLRFIQTGSFAKVGCSKQEKVDIRFVCATNRDPLTEVEAGRFREDLYYRLHVIPLPLPALNERGQDIILIAEHLLKALAQEEGKQFESFSKETQQQLLCYNWPGNVRQLENVIRNIVVLHNHKQVSAEMLPPPLNIAISNIATSTEIPLVKQQNSANEAIAITQLDSLQALWIIEKQAIEHTIASCNGNITKAAQSLEVSASTIYRKMQSWEER